MPLPILPTVFRVAIQHQAPGIDNFMNVMHFSSSVFTPSQVLTALDGAAAAGMFGPTTVDFTTHTAVITKLDGTTPTIQGTLANPNWDGLAATGHVPAAAVCVTLKTTERGRRHTGRVYIGGVSEAVIANSGIDPAIRASTEAAWTTFIANCTSAGIPLHVTSYGHDGAPPPPRPTRPAFTASTTPVLVTTISGLLATQRRRQSKFR